MRPEIYSTPETEFNKFMAPFPVGTGTLFFDGVFGTVVLVRLLALT